MNIDNYFENELFPTIKEYLAENSKYNPRVVKTYTQESKVFPIVTMVLQESTNKYTTLTYGENIEEFYIDINVYSNDVGKTSKRTVCNEISDLIIKWFMDNLKVSITSRKDIENIDTNIHRNYISISGVLDTKYKEEGLTIYPSLNTNRYYNNWFRNN